MKNSVMLVCLLSLILLAPAFARAQGDNYVVGKLGWYSPESSDLEGFSSDFAGGAAFGHYFNPYFALELEVGHLQTSATFFDVSTNLFFTEDISATYIDATAKAVFPLVRRYQGHRMPFLNLYAGAGLGIYFAHDDIHEFGFTQDDTVGGVHIVGGIDFNITRAFFLGFETKYIFVRAFETDLDGFIITGNFGYRF